MNSSGFESSVKKDIFVGERRFYLNLSKSKFVSVSLSVELNYAPSVMVSGNNNYCVVFTEKEWNDLLSYKQTIDNFISSGDPLEPIDAGKFSIEFKTLPYTKVVKIVTSDSSVYLGPNSISTLWVILPIIQNRLDVLRSQQFNNCLKILQMGVKDCDDVTTNALNIMKPIKDINSETYGIALELIYKYPELLKEDIQL